MARKNRDYALYEYLVDTKLNLRPPKSEQIAPKAALISNIIRKGKHSILSYSLKIEYFSFRFAGLLPKLGLSNKFR